MMKLIHEMVSLIIMTLVLTREFQKINNDDSEVIMVNR